MFYALTIYLLAGSRKGEILSLLSGPDSKIQNLEIYQVFIVTLMHKTSFIYVDSTCFLII